MRGFTVILMILVGAVFVAGPAGLLAKLTPDSLDTTFWIIVVFAYYIFATLLPHRSHPGISMHYHNLL